VTDSPNPDGQQVSQERVPLYALQVQIAELIEARQRGATAITGCELISCSELITAFLDARQAFKANPL
jgi:hypothetical protein